ncbi:MAG TPA: hypothetical protein VLK85_01280 [Ramlibacter sp.]|nr:hypothetical protein [Ramlibacter sp.]
MPGRASNPNLLASALLAAGLAGASGAAAQSTRVYSATVPVEIEHDSNPNMVVGNPRGTTWLRVRPTIAMTQVQGTEEYLLEGGLSAEKSSNSDVAKDRVDPRLRGMWRHAGELNTGHVEALLDRRSFRSVDIREAVPTGVDGSRTLMALTGAWTRELSALSSFSANLRQAWERYNVSSTPDFRYTTGSVRLTHQAQERRSWYADVNGHLYRSQDRQDPVLGTVRGTRSRAAGTVVGVNQQFSERFRADASAGVVRFSEPSSDTDWQAALRTEYSGERWQGALDLSRSPSVRSTLGGLEVTRAVRLNVRYSLGPLTRLDVDVGHSKGQVATSRRSLASLALVRELSPAWELTVRATRRQQRELGGTAAANLIALVLVYNAPDF